MTLNNTYPEFSVLMSVYAKEQPQNFDTALRSIEGQTVLPKEIVLVEDGPLTVQLKQVLKRHINRHKELFKIVKSKENHGLGSALRLGTPIDRLDCADGFR